jgi:DNA replication protein DnaC
LGEYGTGKTFLATAIFKHMLWNADTNAAMWRKFYDFIREVQSSYSQAADETVRRVLRRYQSTPLLLLDDVGDLTIQEQTEDRRRLLYEVLDKRNDQMLPTILTSNLSPARFKEQFGERTLERVLEMAALYRMDGRNYRKQPLDQDPMSQNA